MRIFYEETFNCRENISEIYSQFNPSSYFTDLDAGDDVYVRIKLEL